MDPVFNEEQQHLSHVYQKLDSIRIQAEAKLASLSAEAATNMNAMRKEVSLDFSDDENALETVAALESVNSIIDSYNRTSQVNTERLQRAVQLMEQPYFAKVCLQFRPNEKPREIYLGSVGMTDETRRHFIVDWRSPVAETYYNQENGEMSYKANGRTIKVNLTLRRQFDITRDTLNAYFDTTVAIEDPLLLASLAQNHSEKLKAITATIQREQNEIVRHEDVEVLLVNGIAGSGKTSVLLQRIAYLFYQQRDTLSPDQVYLLTPNPVFEKYIDNVLPDMGETNPHILTWSDFVRFLQLDNRGDSKETSVELLNTIENNLYDLKLDPHDFNPISIDGTSIVKLNQLQGLAAKYKHIPVGPRLIALLKEDLHERVNSRLSQLATDSKIQEEMLALEPNEQVRIFGQAIVAVTEQDLQEYQSAYVKSRFSSAHDEVEAVSWLRFDRIGMRITGASHLTAVAWLFLKTLITGAGEPNARYVMIDEVQDYTQAQLMVLSRYFSRAHFLLLGDENQAIHEGTATFPEIRRIFESTHGEISECRLLTSYRSTPEITSLFTKLMDDSSHIKTTSVQREGNKPQIIELSSQEELLAEITHIADTEMKKPGLCALVAPNKKVVASLREHLNDSIQVIDLDSTLPAEGVILLDVALAKGLEFDHVVVIDADRNHYPDTPLSRRRLYTALSRATHNVTVLAQGTLTPLLSIEE